MKFKTHDRVTFKNVKGGNIPDILWIDNYPTSELVLIQNFISQRV